MSFQKFGRPLAMTLLGLLCGLGLAVSAQAVVMALSM
jgi:hypothetical protein